MKNVDLNKKTFQGKTRIMVFGTFDGLHKGHLNFFKQAKNFTENSFLIVSIARDENVLKIKGHKPKLKEQERKGLIKMCTMVNKVVLAGKNKYLTHILKERPDIIALGYDQKAYVKELKKDLKNKGILIKIVRMKPYKEHIYKNHLLRSSTSK
jgi:FAD synthetase